MSRRERRGKSRSTSRYIAALAKEEKMTDSLPPIDHLVRRSAKRAHSLFSAEQAFSFSDDANERRCVSLSLDQLMAVQTDL